MSAHTSEIRTTAAEWIVRLHSASSEERTQCSRECEDWQARDPRHRQVFEQMQQLWTAIPAAPRRRPGRAVAAALAVLLALFIGLQLPWSTWTAAHRTPAGVVQTLRLEDGSTLVLDSRSAADVEFDDAQRVIQLHRGRVWIDVARDGRPLRIQTRDGSATALGTRFSVQQQEDGTRVAVEESRVLAVAEGDAPRASLLLKAGDSALLKDGTVHAGATVSGADFSWMQNRLVFHDRPVPEVIAALAAYRPGLLLVRDSEALRAQRFTGVLPTDDTEAALALLRASLPVRMERLTPWLLWVSAERR